MKAVILAGGLGTRISEESALKPKPMIEIGNKPILWHILKIYSHYDINDFIICCGYKGYIIKEYFANYFLHTSDVTFDMKDNSMQIHHKYTEPWKNIKKHKIVGFEPWPSAPQSTLAPGPPIFISLIFSCYFHL